MLLNAMLNSVRSSLGDEEDISDEVTTPCFLLFSVLDDFMVEK